MKITILSEGKINSLTFENVRMASIGKEGASDRQRGLVCLLKWIVPLGRLVTKHLNQRVSYLHFMNLSLHDSWKANVFLANVVLLYYEQILVFSRYFSIESFKWSRLRRFTLLLTHSSKSNILTEFCGKLNSDK